VKKILAMFLIIMLAACGSSTTVSPELSSSSSSQNPGYLAVDGSYIYFLQYTQSGNNLVGHLQCAYPSNTHPTSMQTCNTAFTGALSGSSITITISLFWFNSSLSGTYNGSTIVLSMPQTDGHLKDETFNAATVDDYNKAVDQLQSNIDTSNQQYQAALATQVSDDATAAANQATATATTDEQNALAYNVSHINDAIGQLNQAGDFSTVLTEYNDRIHKMKADYNQEQSDAAGGCQNYGQVGSDDGNVQSDYGDIQSADGDLQAKISDVDSAISNVQDFIDHIQREWNALGQTSPDVSASDVTNALTNGTNAINQAKANEQQAVSKAKKFDTQANQIQSNADALYNGMNC